MQIDYTVLMRKTLVITFSVALLGLVGLYNSQHSATARPMPASVVTMTPPSVNQNRSSEGQNSGSRYKDGNYTGSVAETPYGDVQVMVMISGGRITDVYFIQMPNDQPHTREVSRDSEPILLQQTLDRQSAKVDLVSGATSTAYGYRESLQAALDKAAGGAFIHLRHYQDA